MDLRRVDVGLAGLFQPQALNFALTACFKNH